MIQESLLEWAQSYSRRGWSIIPTKGKKPAIPWKRFQTQPPDEADLCKFFSRPTVDGLAVIFGRISGGLACRDFDTLGSYEDWASRFCDLAKVLPTVETSRGRHVYFRGPDKFHKFDDGEYRGDAGHYCLLPESRHPSGHVYRWLIPLPDGPLSKIDPVKAGLLPCNTENTDDTENTDTQTTQAPHALSVLSVLHAIEKTLPTGTGQRSRKLFELARSLKAIPETAQAEATELRAIVSEWHRRALPNIRTKEFTDSWSDFVYGWERVKHPAGQGAVEAAFQRAAIASPPCRAIELYSDAPKVLLLVSLCRELQRMAGDKEFFLDCRTAGRLLNVDYTTAWRWLGMLRADRFLTIGVKGSKAKRKASEFRFLEG